MNPFNIIKNTRTKKPRKKSNEEEATNMVLKGTYDNKPKKDMMDESEESKSNILKSKKDQMSYKSREAPSNDYMSPFINQEFFASKENSHLLLQYDSKVSDYASEGFSQEIEGYLRKMTQNKKHTKIAIKYPLLKVLKTILKKFMFNDLETTFWSYFLEQNDWNYTELKEEAKYFPDFLNLSEIADLYEFKTILLYLTLSGFAIKQFLNEQKEMEIFEAHLLNLFPPFMHIYSGWIRRNTHFLQFFPKRLNLIYKKHSVKTKEIVEQQTHNDYNTLVDAIIQISPPYNYDKVDPHDEQQNMPQHSSHHPPIYITQPKNVTIVQNQNSNNAYTLGLGRGVSHTYSSEDYLKKQNSQINQEYHMENNNRLILQKEASSISFDNNTRFENNGLLDALSLARVESKNYNNNNFLIEPDNKNDFYPEFDHSDFYGKNSTNLNNNNSENLANSGFKKCPRKGLKNENDTQQHPGIEEEPELEALSLVKDTSKNSNFGGSKLSLKKNISQFLQ